MYLARTDDGRAEDPARGDPRPVLPGLPHAEQDRHLQVRRAAAHHRGAARGEPGRGAPELLLAGANLAEEVENMRSL